MSITARSIGGTIGTYKDKAGNDIAGGILPPFYANAGTKPAEAAIKAHLKRELKIDLHNKQEKSLIKALTKPDDWLADRKAALDTIADDIAPTYGAALQTYVDAGFPYDEAVAKATTEAQAIYNIKMSELEVMLPGAAVLLTGAVKERKYQGDKAAMYNGPDAIDYKAKYEQRKAKKQAKRAKKAALSTQ